MDFYNYKCKDIKKEISNFNKGSYGKTVFTLAFSPAVIILIITVVIELFGCPNGVICEYAGSLPFWILAVMLSFIAGNMYYYSELRKYMEHKMIQAEQKPAKKETKTKTKKNS